MYTDGMTKSIRIAALAIRNSNDHILHVRKRGTTAFIMVGGKLELGEGGMDAALREVREEIDLDFAESEIEFLGRFTAPAANEADHIVECDVFVTVDQVLVDSISVQREIAEYRWVPLDSAAADLAPLSRDVVHPALQKWLNSFA